jgi:hypothetical protein
MNHQYDLLPEHERGVTEGVKFIGGDDKVPRTIIKPEGAAEFLGAPLHTVNTPAASFLGSPSFGTPHREAAFHLLADKVFGLGAHVPRSTVFRHPDSNEHWSAQEFVPNAKPLLPRSSQLHKYDNTDTLDRLAIMDTVLGQNDRHRNNILVADGNIHLIDNSLSFDYAHNAIGAIPAYARIYDKLKPETHEWIRGLNEDAMKNHLLKAGAPTAIIDTAVARLNEAKAWSQYLASNPSHNRGLGHGLEAIRAHRLDFSADATKEATQVVYDRISRPSSLPSFDPGLHEKTKIQRIE